MTTKRTTTTNILCNSHAHTYTSLATHTHTRKRRTKGCYCNFMQMGTFALLSCL